MSRCKGSLAASLAFVALLGGVRPASAFLEEINPFADTKDSFEGKYIDTIERQSWVPPAQRFAADARRRREDGSPRFGNTRGDPWEERTRRREPEVEAEPVPPIDGLSWLRMGEVGLVDSPALESYVTGLAERLLAGSPITGAPIRVRITADPDYPSAKALPDGTLGIPLGLIRSAESEDELAAALAHEMSHVLLGHHDSDWFQAAHEGLISATELGLGFAIAFNQRVGTGDGLAGKALAILLIARGSLLITGKGLFPSWQREQEDEADLLGLDLLVRAGYNPDGMFMLLDKLRRWEEIAATRPDPRAEQRAALMQEADEQAARGNLSSAIQTALGGLFLELGAALDEIAGGHREAAAREESLLDYFDREYGDLDPPDMSAYRLVETRKRREVQTVLAGYATAEAAYERLQADDLKAAESLAKKAVSGPLSDQTWPRYVFFETRLRQGRKDKAARNLELALAGREPTLLVYRNLSELYWQRGERERATNLLARAWDELDRPPALYPDLIYRYQMIGNQPEANRLATECQFRRRKAGRACAMSAQGRAPDDLVTRPAASGRDESGEHPGDLLLRLFE